MVATLNLTGILFEFGLALPFAIGLAIHTQLFGRPNFHIAACFAAIPLITVSLSTIVGGYLALGIGLVIGAALIFVVEKAVIWIDGASESNIARAFFESAVIYLLIIQIVLLSFGAAPRSLIFYSEPELRVVSVNISVSAWFLFVFGVVLSAIAILSMDGRFGSKLRMIGGDVTDAIALGLNQKRLAVVALIAVALLISLASLSRAMVLPFSAYSSFTTYILCFCAATLPPGYRVGWTAALLLIIFTLRSILTAQLGASVADAFTLTIVLVTFAVGLSARTISREDA